ncbi:hypothetical protein PR048_023508 [Dryococelus australis]|uniref:Uncharacterized protein n=1 Tax=Dryococelus australis TaxID=614101 RepID=A0ABQ9GUA4_9NEOP|nr:hypothetical protein PR048_023508 [Dryococelus australis]
MMCVICSNDMKLSADCLSGLDFLSVFEYEISVLDRTIRIGKYSFPLSERLVTGNAGVITPGAAEKSSSIENTFSETSQSSFPNSEGRQDGKVAVQRQQGTSVEVKMNYRKGLTASRAGNDTDICANESTTTSGTDGLLSAGLRTVGGTGLAPGHISCKAMAASEDENRAHGNMGISVGNFNITNCSGREHPNSMTWDAILAELKVLTHDIELLEAIKISSANDGHSRHRNCKRKMHKAIPAKTEASCQTVLSPYEVIPLSNNREKVNVSSAFQTSCMQSNDCVRGFARQGLRPNTVNSVIGRVIKCTEMLCYGRVDADIGLSEDC